MCPIVPTELLSTTAAAAAAAAAAARITTANTATNAKSNDGSSTSDANTYAVTSSSKQSAAATTGLFTTPRVQSLMRTKMQSVLLSKSAATAATHDDGATNYVTARYDATTNATTKCMLRTVSWLF